MANAASQRSQATGSTCFLLVILQQRPFCVISSHDLHDACHAATRMTPLWMLCKSGPPLAWRCWCPGPQAASSELRGGCEALLCVKATRRGLILLLAAAAKPAAKEPARALRLGTGLRRCQIRVQGGLWHSACRQAQMRQAEQPFALLHAVQTAWSPYLASSLKHAPRLSQLLTETKEDAPMHQHAFAPTQKETMPPRKGL